MASFTRGVRTSQPPIDRLNPDQLVAIQEVLGLPAVLPHWHTRGRAPLRLEPGVPIPTRRARP